MNILIIGAGAIGGYLGGKLAVQHNVTLLGRAKLVEAVRANGLKIVEPYLQFHGKTTQYAVRNLAAVDSLADAFADGAHFDLALFCVKTYATAATIDQLRPYAARIDHILSLQNGVDSEDLLGAACGREKISAATILNPIVVPEAGVVRLEKRKGGIGLAPVQSPIDPLVEVMRGTQLPVRVYADYRSMKWSKLILNLIGNATSAILDMTTRETFADQRLFELEVAALRETIAVMRARSIKPVPLPGYPVPLLVFGLRFAPSWLLHRIMQPMVASGRGDKPPSLLMDLRGGRTQSEIDDLNGAVVRVGQAIGLKTPINALLVDTLHDLLIGKTDRVEWRRNADRLIQLTGA